MAMASSMRLPAKRRLEDVTMPPKEMTATSVVPPPMSTTMEPVGSVTGRSAPMAAAMGSSIRYAWRAPACTAASNTARFSTEVAPHGMQMTMRGLACHGYLRGAALLMNALIIASVTS